MTGAVQEGQTLTGGLGTWIGLFEPYNTPQVGWTAQWQRCTAAGTNCADISGASAFTRYSYATVTYTPTVNDVGLRLRLSVTATPNDYGPPSRATTAYSNTTALVSGHIGPPTSKAQCENGGWQQFDNPFFKNQADCVHYVKTH